MLNRRLVIGKFGSPYGIHGWIHIFSFTEKCEGIFSYQPWFVYRGKVWQSIEQERHHQNGLKWLVKLKGIDDRTKACFFKGCDIAVYESQFSELEQGEYYWKDIIGCQVSTIDGVDLGYVSDIMETASNDVLVVRKDVSGKLSDTKSELIPFLLGKVIKKVDINKKNIKVVLF